MKLLVISQVPPPHHGSTIMTVVLIDTLTKLGVETRLVDRRFSTTIGEVGRPSVSKVFRGLGLIWRLGATLATFRPSKTVFFVTNRPASFIVDWALSELLRLTRSEVIAYVHTRGFRSLADRNGALRWMVGRLLGSADLTVCLGESLIEDVGQWVAEDTVSIIHNTPLNTPVGPVPAVGDRTRVLFLSNLIAEKGADTFVELSLRMSADYPDVTFTVAGNAVDDSVRDDLHETVKLAGASNVQFWGPAAADEKWKLLSEAKILVFPTRYQFEAQPLTIIEAMSVGTPTIAYDVGGIRDIVDGDHPGILVPADELEILETKLRSFLDNAETHATASEEALKSFESQFGSATFSERWNRVLGMPG